MNKLIGDWMEKIKGNKKFFHLILIAISIFIANYWFIIKPLKNDMFNIKFELNRLVGIGNFFSSPTNFEVFGGQGKMDAVFYPNVTLWPLIIFKWIIPKLTLFIRFSFIYISILNALVSYFTMKTFSKNENKAAAFSIISVLATYISFKLGANGVLSDILGFIFLPIVFLGIYYLFYDNYQKWYLFTIGMLLIYFSHNVTFKAAIFMSLVYLIIALMQRKISLIRLKYLALSCSFIMVGILITYIPMMSNDLNLALDITHRRTHIAPPPIFWWVYQAMGFDSVFGFSVFVMNLFLLFKFKKLNQFSKVSLVVANLFFVFSTRLIPWTYLLEKQYVLFQDIYNLLSITCALIPFLFVANFEKIIKFDFNKNENRNMIAVLIVASVFNIVYLINGVDKAQMGKSTLDKESWLVKKDRMYPNLDSNYTNGGFDNHLAKDFLIDKKTVDINRSKYKNFLINNKVAQITNLNILKSSLNFDVKTSKDNVILKTPLTKYAHTKVSVNDKEVGSRVSSISTLEFQIKKKGLNHIKFEVKYSSLDRLAQLLSIISWLILILMLVLNINVNSKLVLKATLVLTCISALMMFAVYLKYKPDLLTKTNDNAIVNLDYKVLKKIKKTTTINGKETKTEKWFEKRKTPIKNNTFMINNANIKSKVREKFKNQNVNEEFSVVDKDIRYDIIINKIYNNEFSKSK